MHEGTDTECVEAEGILPISPFTAMQFHFGMLLGVDDLETLDGYGRGKMRLHNAWLHREGVVWGLDVTFVAARGEIQVSPGLALDAAGRELHLDDASCLNLAAWWQLHQGDFQPRPPPDSQGVVTFDAHVVARFKACLSRPVPAITDTCSGGARDVAASRAEETVELLLRAGPPPVKPLPYHRLRVLFSLEDPVLPDDADIVARRDTIRAAPLGDQPKMYLQAFREYAALDGRDLEPAQDEGGRRTLFPATEGTEVLLAKVTGVRVKPSGTSWVLIPPDPVVDIKGRPTHVATATIQELLNGPLFGTGGTGGTGGGTGGSGGTTPPATRDAGGPRFKRDSVKLDGHILTLESDKPLAKETIHAGAFKITSFDPRNGWSNVEIRGSGVDKVGTHVRIVLKEQPAGDLIRFIARGSNDWPILGPVGTALVPLAGAVGDGEPPGTAVQGNDFVHMWKRS